MIYWSIFFSFISYEAKKIKLYFIVTKKVTRNKLKNNKPNRAKPDFMNINI